MSDIIIRLTPDELANTITAVERHLEYLADLVHPELPDDDLPAIIDSYQRALLALNEAGYDALGGRT